MMLLEKSPDVFGKKSGCFRKKVGTFFYKGPDVFLFLFFLAVCFLQTHFSPSSQASISLLAIDSFSGRIGRLSFENHLPRDNSSFCK